MPQVIYLIGYELPDGVCTYTDRAYTEKSKAQEYADARNKGMNNEHYFVGELDLY